MSEQRYTRVLLKNILVTQFNLYIQILVLFLFLLLFTIFSILIFPSASAIRRYPVLVLQTPPLPTDFLELFTLPEILRLNTNNNNNNANIYTGQPISSKKEPLSTGSCNYLRNS